MILPTNKRDNILTKALLKLYSYKIVSSSFHECGDYEPFYALTRYIPESFDLKKEINFSKMFDGNEIEAGGKKKGKGGKNEKCNVLSNQRIQYKNFENQENQLLKRLESSYQELINDSK